MTKQNVNRIVIRLEKNLYFMSLFEQEKRDVYRKKLEGYTCIKQLIAIISGQLDCELFLNVCSHLSFSKYVQCNIYYSLIRIEQTTNSLGCHSRLSIICH